MRRSDLSKANDTAPRHIQQHGFASATHVEQCQECGKDFSTAERFQRLCPRCDTADKRAHEQAHQRPFYKRDDFSAKRRAQSTDLEIARAEVVGATCHCCDEVVEEGQKVIVSRDYTGTDGRTTMRVMHAVCPNPLDGAA